MTRSERYGYPGLQVLELNPAAGDSHIDKMAIKDNGVGTLQGAVMSRPCAVCVYLGLLSIMALAGVGHAGEWEMYPTPRPGDVRDYTAPFDKHFKLVDGVLVGRCGLGAPFFAKAKGGVFSSVGMIWATDRDWPRSNDDFELTLEYKWFQDEPLKKYGDFPDLHVGFRLGSGKGYYLRWGMLGQVILRRMDEAEDVAVAQGTHPGMKDRWAKVRLRAAGSILKVKIWPAAKPEPSTWTAEAYDDWQGTNDYQRGAVAIGFVGRKLFDTCVYEFKDVKLRPLTADEVKAEKSFNSAAAPAYVGFANGSDTTAIKYTGLDIEFTSEDAIKGYTRDDNLLVVGVTGEGASLKSKDGKPAYLWIPVESSGNLWGVRAKATDESRPLFAVKAISREGKIRLGYVDPKWRDGFAALLYETADHTSGAYRYDFKPDSWRDFLIEKAHWQKWQIMEPGNPASRAAFVSSLIKSEPASRGSKVMIGIGVVGNGSVTVRGTLKR